MPVQVPIKIRYAETDCMGIVYHANYLLYFEDARNAFLEAIGQSYDELEKAGYLSPVVSFTCKYGTPLRYGDTAIVSVRVAKTTAVKTTYAYEVYNDHQSVGVDKPCCTGQSVHCLVEADTFNPVSMKQAAPELYAKYLEVCEPDRQ
ncbi:MAG: thioesterase family protein [Raoultibacter sp.]